MFIAYRFTDLLWHNCLCCDTVLVILDFIWDILGYISGVMLTVLLEE